MRYAGNNTLHKQNNKKPYSHKKKTLTLFMICLHQFVCVEVLRPSQPNGVMSSAVSLPNHTFTGHA